MSTRKKALFAAVVLVWSFASAELILRIVGFATRAAAPAMRFHVPEIRSAGYDVDPETFWRLKPDFQGVVSDNHPWTVRTNSHGTRGGEFALEKPPGTIRIVSIGDSSAFGWGVPEELSYASQLESLLNERLSDEGRRFEVVNAGVPGYTSHQGLAYFRRDLLRLEPDIVLTYFGLNDLTGARFYSDREQALQGESVSAGLLRQSRVYQAMWRLLRSPASEGRFDGYFKATDHFRVPPEEYRENLAEIQRLVEQRGGRALFIRPTWRSPDGRFHAHAFWLRAPLDLLEGLSPVADTHAPLKDLESEAGRLFMDTAHPTDHGHAIMAEEIYRSLIENGMVGG